MSKSAPVSGRKLLVDDRVRAIGDTLEKIRAGCDVRARVERDPVGIVRRFDAPSDREVVGLLASSMAFGNVVTIRAKLDDVLLRIGPEPARALDDESLIRARLEGFVHRVFRGEDVAGLLLGARRIQRQYGTLGALFARELKREGALHPALLAWSQAIRREGGLDIPSSRRGPAHLLPARDGSSACKRALLFLRWMIRPDDGVDLGVWDIPPRVLVCPVDTHIHKLARNLGFTTSRTANWKAAEEITGWLRVFDPEDPVKYDFSLCHMGMLQRCPSRRDATRCGGCPVAATCRHWAVPRRRPSKRSVT